MNTSEGLLKIYGALISAQKDFPSLKKDADNPYFKSKYVELSSVLEAINPIMQKNGLMAIQFPEAVTDGKLSITTRIVHESGEWIESTAQIPLAKSDPQGFGSALTYGKRYALVAALGLIAEDDDDANSATGNAVVPLPQRKSADAPKSAELPLNTPSADVITGRIITVAVKQGISKPSTKDGKQIAGKPYTIGKYTVENIDGKEVEIGSFDLSGKAGDVAEFSGIKNTAYGMTAAKVTVTVAAEDDVPFGMPK